MEPTAIQTLKEAITLFEEVGMPARNLAVRTRSEYKHDLEDLADFLEHQHIHRLEQISLAHLVGFQAEMDRRHYQESTRRRKTIAIKSFFKFITRHGVISHNVASQLIPPRVTRHEPRYLSEEEYGRLLRAGSHHPRDAAIIELFLQTGMRLAELANLTLADVELPRKISKEPEDVGEGRGRRKGGKIEKIPLNYKACKALKNWLNERPAIGAGAMFISKFRNPLSKRAIQYVMEKYLKEARIVGASVHTLRHTMATHHAIQGTDAKTIQETLGHASLVTTELYISLAKKAHAL